MSTKGRERATAVATSTATSWARVPYSASQKIGSSISADNPLPAPPAASRRIPDGQEVSERGKRAPPGRYARPRHGQSEREQRHRQDDGDAEFADVDAAADQAKSEPQQRGAPERRQPTRHRGGRKTVHDHDIGEPGPRLQSPRRSPAAASGFSGQRGHHASSSVTRRRPRASS